MPATPEPLSGEDLAFWYSDQPRQRTTMALLLLLDRRPHSKQLRAAAWRAIRAVPRLRQRVVDAPFDLARPTWQDDPTFDLDFHIRRYALSHEDGATEHATLDDLFHTIGPIYERPFDRTRPLWELIELDGPGPGSAVFFRLHHAVADGVGGNAILAALTDDSAESGADGVDVEPSPGSWPDEDLATRLRAALGQRLDEARAQQRAVWDAAWTALREPASLARAARIAGAVLEDARDTTASPLTGFGRARHLSGIEVPFQALREARDALGGKMIDVLLTAVTGAVGEWHAVHGYGDVAEVRTQVPINLRARADQGLAAGTGNRATGVSVKLPIAEPDPAARFAEIHRRMEERKVHPAVDFMPKLSEMLAVLPRPVYRALTFAGSQSVNLIVTNVPGIMQPRYLAGARITAGYPFAPTAPQCPVSVALYGYDGRLYVGVDADGSVVSDLDEFCGYLDRSFDRVIAAAARRRSA
ncbi:MAG: wax ester/triacylglycerol synthase domain-containing protein [Myxococcota bacterium]